MIAPNSLTAASHLPGRAVPGPQLRLEAVGDRAEVVEAAGPADRVGGHRSRASSLGMSNRSV